MLNKKTKKLFLGVFFAGIIVFSFPLCAESLQNKRTDIYLQALSMTKNYAEIRKVLQREIAATDGKDIARLMHLAQCGVENNLLDIWT